MTSLPQRQLGAGGPAVSAVGLGCMSISWGYYLDPQDESVSERTLQRAVELGVTHFDTASLYGRGHNETLVGRALRDRPAERADRVQVRARESRLPEAQDGARRPARDDPATVRGLARTPRRRDARPLLPAPRRSRRARRGERRHALRARRGGQDPPHRHVGVHGRRARARPRHPPGERAAERVLAVDTRTARGRHPVVRSPRRRPSWPSACSAAAS